LGSAISNIALFEAEMSGDAYQLMGMADRGLIPKWFAKRSRFDTPVNGIFVGTLVIVMMSLADFNELVEMLNFAYSFSYLMEFAAFIKLRITENDGMFLIAWHWDALVARLATHWILLKLLSISVDRPYRIPLNTFGCICFALPPSLFLIYLILIASKTTYIYCVGICVFGFVFQGFQKMAKHYDWVKYAEAPTRNIKRNGVDVEAPNVR
jgi:amino acid transporter